MKKTLMAVLTLILTSSFAYAAETFQCKGDVPPGTALLTLESEQGHPTVFMMKLHNDGLNEDFDGVFYVTNFRGSDGSFLADGIFTGKNAKIKSNLQGSIKPEADGSIFFAVYAAGDHRIEYGYGLWLGCRPDAQ